MNILFCGEIRLFTKFLLGFLTVSRSFKNY